MIREQQAAYKLFKFSLLILVILGMLMLYSASSRYSYYLYSDPGHVFYKYAQRMFIALLFGGALFMLDTKHLRLMNRYIFFGALAAVIFPYITKLANPHQYTARWLDLGSLQFQTAEIARFALIIFTANYIDKNSDRLTDLNKGFLPYTFFLLIFIVLLALTPDFSTSFVMFTIFMIIFWIGGASFKHVAGTGLAAAVMGIIYVRLADYRWDRVLSFFNSSTDPASKYQADQSLLSLGSGGLFGKSLGGGMGKNMYLPEAHTDFIFSVLGEEWGFVGAMGMILLFILLFLSMYILSYRIKDVFSRVIVFSTAFFILMYALVNAAVCTRIFPVTGLPMPFVSYSGSQLVINSALLGIVFRIFRQEQLNA